MPGARHLFSHLQNALSAKMGGRVTLTWDVHPALDDFRWLFTDITSRPTRLAELIPLASAAEGHHDASSAGAGGIWFPSPSLKPREGFRNGPVVWRLQWPEYIVNQLISSTNPNGSISNSDLELAGGLLHLEALAQCFDARERTALSKTDNLNALFCQRKASLSSDKVPPHLLCLFGIHQRYHRYVPQHDYISGVSNPVADALLRDFFLLWKELLDSVAPHLPVAPEDCQVWMPSPHICSAVTAALTKKRLAPGDVLVETKPADQSFSPRECTPLSWALHPLSRGRSTKLGSYKASTDEYVVNDLRPEAIPPGQDRLKVPYGTLKRRPADWCRRSTSR